MQAQPHSVTANAAVPVAWPWASLTALAAVSLGDPGDPATPLLGDSQICTSAHTELLGNMPIAPQSSVSTNTD